MMITKQIISLLQIKNLTTKEISSELNLNENTTSGACSRLKKREIIKSIGRKNGFEILTSRIDDINQTDRKQELNITINEEHTASEKLRDIRYTIEKNTALLTDFAGLINDRLKMPKKREKYDNFNLMNIEQKIHDYVYFIQAKKGGAIKIGHSKNPEQRLSQLQGANPDTLRLLAIIEDDSCNLESELHDHFAKDNISGEWFKPSIELLQYILNLKVMQ